MKYLRIYTLLLSLTVFAAYYTVSGQDTAANSGYTSPTAVGDKPIDTGMTALGAGIIAIGVVILATGIYYMVRNRRRNIGGIQSQDKSEPTPRTPESINNPGAGV